MQEPLRDLRPPLTLASRGVRFAANLVDGAVFVIPFLIAALTGGFLAQPHADDPETGAVIAVVLLVGVILGVLGLQLRSHVRYGQSLGKRALAIRVVRPDGSPASLTRLLLLRSVPKLLAAMTCLLGIADVLAIFGQRRRCLHDHLADTVVVVDAPAPEP